MANPLRVDLHGQVVLLHPDHYTGPDLRYLVTGGFGAAPGGIGRGLFGRFVADGERALIESDSVVSLAPDQTLPAELELDRAEAIATRRAMRAILADPPAKGR